MMTPVTLLRDFCLGIDVSHPIRAGGHAVPAADTPVGIDVDYPVGALDASIDWTDGDTDWPGAVVTDYR
ncbi:unnamed protein product [marine sediment metagenome]|uniref:Uncharacterized protein n=1 Tax=marine sediment metagenome TaxID=412755 RepID=X1HB16_9ZZZZ